MNMPAVLITARQLAVAVGRTDRAMRKALDACAVGKMWNGHPLPTVRLPCQRGGAGGEVWGLDLAQADEALLHAYPALRELAEQGEKTAPSSSGREVRGWQTDEQQARLRIIQPVLAAAPRCRARGKILRSVASEWHMYRGELRQFSEPTLKRWVSAYETKGLAGLMPRSPEGRGQRRTLITRRWDSEIDLPDEGKGEIAAALEMKAIGWVGNDDASGREVINQGEQLLARLCRGAGSAFKGITQEHVTQSLAQVTLCPYGGFANEYYLDNGSEYAALNDGVGRLSALADQDMAHIVKAEPYRPQSKGWIEGAFRILQCLFKGLPGYIGGDRTAKKTENKGQVVAPYMRGLEQLAADIQACVAVYNNRPQKSGRLGGLSPLEMLERKFADTGFVARVPSEDAFDIIFSMPRTPTVSQSEVRIGGEYYTGAALNLVPAGQRVNVLVPMRNKRDRVILVQGNEHFWLERKPVFAWGDPEGAKYQARLEKSKMDAIRALGANVDPNVSILQDQLEGVERVAPNVPAPETWSTQPIYATHSVKTDAEADAEEHAQRRADIEEFLAITGGNNRGASGCRR